MSWIKRILVIFIPILIGFCSLELGVRIIHSLVLNSKSIQHSEYSNIYSDERDRAYLYWHKPNISVKLEGTSNDNFTLTTNILGHRSLSDTVNFEKSIVFIGDSIIEGASVENDETIPYLVSQNIGVPTINLGLGSSNTVQQYLLGKEKILPEFNMQMLVLGLCLNDIEGNLYRKYFEPDINNWKYFDSVTVTEDFMSHSYSNRGTSSGNSPDFLRKIKNILRNSEALRLIYRIIKNGLNPTRAPSEEAWINTEYFIKKIANLAAGQGAKFVVIIFPYQDQIEGRFEFNEQKKLKQILERNQIKYFDPKGVLLQNMSKDTDASNMYYDNIHPNKLGSLLIAEAFSNYLLSNYLNTGD